MRNTIITNEEKTYLMNKFQSLLPEYDYRFSDYGLEEVIDEWAYANRHFIEAFKRHSKYVKGKFMIAFECNYDRAIDIGVVNDFVCWLKYHPIMELVNDVPAEIEEQRLREHCIYLPRELFEFFVTLSAIATTPTISVETAEKINELLPNIRAREGQKLSKIINKICTYLGYHKHPDYNHEYAKFADAVSPKAIKRCTVLSINPLDYLTMSFGNSWASCHTIDKNNRRGMPNNYSGCYSSGTMSYMLDSSSMVLYTVDASYDGDEYWSQPKINRQMFHWGEEKLVQGRLYPQDNDGNNDIYKPYRQIVQEIIAEIFGFPNLWTVKKGANAAGRYINTYGTHYDDYNRFDSCTLSRVKDSENENDFIVGAEPICIVCGERHERQDKIVCHCCDGNVCSRCGCVISDPDDQIVIDDEIYCHECVSYCHHCHQYVTTETTYVDSVGYSVCQDCLDEDFEVCEDCGEYFRYQDTYEVDGYFYCDECHDERFGDEDEE